MVRRGQQVRRALNRAAAEVAQEIASPQGSYQAPPREDCSHKSWPAQWDDAGTVRITTMIWRHGGRLVDFVILVELSDLSAWAPISRIDCCHGFCHVHPPGREQEQRPIHRLDTVDDVEIAYVAASEIAEQIARTIRDTKGNHDHE